jgi:Zn-dependent protease/CBS domain-containing protein
MGASLRLFQVRGIAVRVHFTFLLVVLWAAYLGFAATGPGDGSLWQSILFAEIFVLLLFVCVVMHELAHALTAQLFEVRVEDITLWPLGGVARMAAMPETPFAEFVITAAGPAMSLFLALALAAILLIWIGPQTGLDLALAPGRTIGQFGQWDARNLLLLLALNNLILAVFNLIPAFPLDGGRLLRSLLAAFLPFGRATRVASLIGQGLAGLILIAAVLGQNILLGLVAVFIFVMAGQERQQVSAKGNLAGLRVRQVMQPLGPRLHPLETLDQIAQQMANSAQSFYLVVDGGRLVGVLSRGDVLAGLRRHGPTARVNQQMTRDILRLGPDDPLTVARDRLAQNNTWLAVVVSDGQVIGTLSQGDLNRLNDLLNAYPAVLPRT